MEGGREGREGGMEDRGREDRGREGETEGAIEREGQTERD